MPWQTACSPCGRQTRQRSCWTALALNPKSRTGGGQSKTDAVGDEAAAGETEESGASAQSGSSESEGTGTTETPSTNTDQEQGTSQTDETNNSAGEAAGSGEAVDSDNGANTDGQPTNDAEQTSQQEERTDPRSWEGDFDALVLSSTGLVFTDPEDGYPAEDIEKGTLPDELRAQLNLEFELDPAQWAENPENTRAAVIAGDTVTVPLPENFAPIDPDAKLDVFQLDENDEPTTIRIATAEVVDGALKITFIAPEDTETGETYLVGAAPEATDGSEQTPVLATLHARIDLDVLVPASLVGDEASELTWTLQEDTKGEKDPQTATLEVPARAELLEQLGLAEDEAAGDEADGEGQAPANEEDVDAVIDLAGQALNDILTRDGTQTISYSYDKLSGSASMRITWCDNNSSGRPDMGAYAAGVIPQFQLGNKGEWIDLVDADGNLTQAARDALHIADDSTPAWVQQAVASVVSVGTWNLSVSGLPTQLVTTTTAPDLDENGNPQYDEHGNLIPQRTEVRQDITWRLNDTNTRPGGYTYGENDDGATGGQRYLMLTQTYEFTIEGKLGEDTLKEIFGGTFNNKDCADHFRFSALIDNQQVTDEDGNARYGTIASRASATYPDGQSFSVSFNDDGTATITATLPRYTEDGAPIVYYAYFEDSDAGTGADYFQPAYDNSASPSHGSSVDALYDGGTMTLRPMGTTSYDAEKVWLDGDKTDRPGATFTLWRYSTHGSAATAAQVQLNEVGSADAGETEPGASVSAVGYVQITIPEGSGNSVDLGQLLAEQYGEQGTQLLDNLPKYDPDGYPYIYALREEATPAGYEAVYGTVGEDGRVSDTNPNYTDENGETQWLDAPNRTTDHFIYNDGTITNRLTGTVEVEATKTWEIAAFQDSLDDVVVEFTAQSRIKGSDDAWQDTDKTIDVDGWKAEILTQTFSDTFPQYDAHGNELEYRWVETGVTLGDQETSFERNDNGGGTFTLTLQNEEGEDEQLAFTSTLDSDTNTITNTFENVTEEHVDKYWEQPDGSLAQIKPQDGAYEDHPDLDTTGVAHVQLFQNGSLVGTFELDGTTDAQATPIEGLDGATYQETRSYHLDFEDLPKYDEGGVRYSYLVLEAQTPDGWYADRTYDAETHTTRIDNRIGAGESSEVRIIKNWNDGDDSQHRLPVAVNLVALHDMQSKAINADGTPRYSYEAGEAVNATPIILTAAETWYAEYTVPIGGLTYKDFKIVELYLIGTDADGNEVHYPVVDSEEAPGAYDHLTTDREWMNVGWTEGTERVATPDHVYEVSATETAEPQYNEDVQAVTATNRRLGLVDLTVEKNWKDQGEHTRPAARIVLTSTEYPDAFTADTDGNVWVQVSDNKLPVLDNEGNQLNMHNPAVGADGIVPDGAVSVRAATDDEPSAVVITVNTDSAEYTSEYHFFGLPKYDEHGDVVHYDVNEEWLGAHDEYTSSKTVGEYTVGSRHFHDTQTFTFTNTRQGTRDVTFNKLWQDRYVNDDLRQRPDIYLTLYRVTVGENADGQITYSDPEQVDGYVHYLWTGTADAENPQYEQSCTISRLPAYDENGSEYIYYASESMSADGTSLDYKPVYFDYTNMATVHEGESAEPQAVNVDSAYVSANPTENGTGWAIHEDGTFVNELADNLVARGTKLWEDVPGNVSQAGTGDGSTALADTDLPEVTVYLQQRVQGGDWPSLTFSNQNGVWTPNAEGAVAWTSDLAQVRTNQYSYTLTHTGENTAKSAAAAIDEANPTLPEGAELLPRYTDDGRLYEYRAIEVVWGLLDQPGGFTSEWIQSGGENGGPADFSAIRDSEEDSMGIYVIEHGETGSFLISNIYSSPTGNLTVQKHYTGREAGDRYPDTTFDVYRYYVRADGSQSDAALVDSVTLTNNMLKAEEPESLDGLTVEHAGEETTTAQYTFSGLDIYAPDGSYWQYYVVEHNINGYTTTVGVGNLGADAVTDAGEAVDGGVSSGVLCPEEGTADAPEPGDGQATREVTGTVLAEMNGDQVEMGEDGQAVTDTDPDVTFKNNYATKDTDLTGTKTWSDFNNIFNLRPTVEEFTEGLTVTQIGNGAETDITNSLQSKDENNPYYFTVTTSEGSNNYTIKLNNVPLYAPDGTAYRYRITENLSGMVLGETGDTGESDAGSQETADGYYTASNESSMVTAGSDGQFSFTNSLKGQATVKKVWHDGGDPYGLRPTSVTVRLQARYTYAGGETGDWQDPVKILNDLGYWKTFASQFETEDAARAFFQKTLNADNGWRASWTDLPTAGRGTAEGHAGMLFTIDYRVVEVAIGDQEIDQPEGTGENYSFQYTPNEGGEYHPYQPAQDSWTNENGHSDTTISNALEGTSISATKSWDDSDNVWGTRPGGNNWSVTYLLQRKLGADGDWTWVVGYGDPEATTPLDSNIVRETITASDENGTATWDNLPMYAMYDTNGKAYEYRVVEQVPGSYDVEGGTEVDTATANGVTYRYYVVDSTEGTGDAPDSQTFTNDLRTTTLTGTKKWDDHGTGLASGLTEDDMPTMTLYRAIVTGRDAEGNPTSFGGAEPVTYHGSDDGQPTWTVSGDTWTFTYEGLPAANEDDVEYVYWAEEQPGSAEGYYPLYGSENPAGASHDAAGTTIDTPATAGTDGSQTNEQITNVATQLTLDKVSDFSGDTEDFDGVELRVTSRDGNTTYARWIKNADDTVQTYTWVNGTTAPEETGDAVSRTDGLIVGLHAGAYQVNEVAETVPEGYALADPVNFEIETNGTAATAGSVTTETEGGIHTIEVTATDPVLRAHLQLMKYVSADGSASGQPLAGAKFDLYRDGYDDPIAQGLTSDNEGKVTTNSSANGSINLSEAFQSDHGGKYTTLADGLPEGTYYFVETDATTGAVMPDATKSPELKITQTDHGTIVSTIAGSDDPAQMGNEDFSATVKLHKYDSVTNDPVSGAAFTVVFTPEKGSATTLDDSWAEADGTFRKTFSTNEDGVLTLDNLEKGSYTVTEASNTGYESGGFSATFAISEVDDDQTYDITTTDDENDAVKAIGFEVTSGDGTFVDGEGIPNTPKRGSVTMTKRGANNTALNGATFELQRLGDDGTTWETIAEDLVTGQSYAMNDENSALDGAGEAGTAGQITVTNLLWGTYKFVETAPAPGYIGVDDEGTALESKEVTVNRTNGLNAAALAGTVKNAPTSLELNKQNDVGQPLEGAAFQIAAQGDSVFANPDAFAAGTYDEATKTVTLPTDSTGHIELTGQLVVGGTYTVYESAAPSGYDPADGVLTIEVQPDGSLEVQGELPDRYARADLDEDGNADNACSFMVTNLHEEIELRKVSTDNPDVPVEGAVFTLTGMCMDNNSTHTYTTDEDGVIKIDDGLMGGVRYALTETTPGAGYVARPDTLYFMMDTRGEIQVTDAQGNPLDQANWPAGYTVDEDGISLTVTDESVDLQIAKIDPDGNPLPGAVFRVTPAPGTNTTFADGSAEVQDLRTGEDGTCYWGAKLVVGGTYDITEVSAPEGYERVTGTMRVTVADDGTINVVGSVGADGELDGQLPPTGYEKVADNAFEVQVTNKPVEISIIKVDGDDHARYLPGATFEVTGAFAGSNEKETRRYTVDATGELMGTKNISAELKSGETYKLTETAAPAGYELIKGTLSFKVNENGTVEAVGDVPAGYSIEQGNVTIVAADEPIEVSFAKKDLGDTNLAGARFTLSGTFVNDATHETSQQSIPFDTTNEAFTFDALSYEGATYSLVAGQTYTLTEDAAPAGYEKLPAFSFTVAYDGTITVANDSTEATDGTPGYVIDEQGGTVTLTAHDRPIEVRLQKRGTDTGDALLGGAVFSLLNAETGEVLDDDVRPTADGAVELTGLVGGGTYTLRETTAPAGYELVADVTFTVGTDGGVTITNGATGWTAENADSGVATLTAADEPVEARLVKTDADGTALSGATFEITGEFAGTPALNANGALEVGPTGEDGVAAIPTGVLVAGNTYTITEATAPSGYELAGSVQFTVGADGTITIGSGVTAGSGTYAATAADGTAVITANDALTELTVLKAASSEGASGGKTYLPGAEFTLTEVMGEGSGAGGSQVLTDITGEDGSVSFTGLVANTSYVLEETRAPAGYERLTDTATLSVAADGTVSITGGNSSGAFTLSEDGVSIEVVDHKLGVSLVKQGIAGQGLEGVEFTLAPAEDGATFPDGTAEKSFTSDEFGAVFTDLQLTGSAEGTAYVLTETEAPAGYQPIDPLTFLVYEDGTVALADTATTEQINQTAIVNDAEDGIAVITVSDTPIDLVLQKSDPEGTALQGAEFTVSPVDDATFADGTTEPKTIATADGGTALLSAQLVAGSTYEIYESRGPVGYDPIDATFQVTAHEDGSLTVVGGDSALPEGYARAKGSTFTFTAVDQLLKIELQKVSALDPETTLANAEFTLTGDDGTIQTVTTDDQGAAAIGSGLKTGVTYTLTETTPAAGYIAVEPLSFQLDIRGEIVVQGDAPDAWAVGEDGITLTATDEPVGLRIEKIDAEDSDKKLPGAEFAVTPVDGSTFADGTTTARTLTTEGEDGSAELLAELVVGGTYRVEETTAPDGYTKIDGTLTIHVRDDGTIEIAPDTAAPGAFVISDDGTVQAFTGTVTNEPTKLTLYKLDERSNQPIANVEFTLTGDIAGDGTSEEAERTLVSTTEGVELDHALLIADGETVYTLHEEEAPAGYETIEDLKFTVEEDGSITPVDEATAEDNGWAWTDGQGIAVTAHDDPVEIDLVKRGSDTGDELVGAEFTIKPAAGGTFANAQPGENEQGIVVTPENAQDKLYGRLVVGKSYVLEETQAPAGYELAGSLEFTVNADGTIEKTGGSDAYAVSSEGDVAVITATDTPIEVRLQKRGSDAGDALLGGAVFSLLDAGTGEVLDDDVKPTADGAIELTGLVGGGTYTLRETTAPAGYELVGDVTFSVANDGTVSIAGGAAGWAVENADSGVATLTATDEPVEARLVKTDADGAPLAGAGFEIVPAAGSSFAGEPELTEDGALEVGPTGDDGVAAIPTGVLVAGETYTVSEITSPDGYELAGAVTFTVGADGTIALDGAAAGAPVAGASGSGTYAATAEGGTAVITATDELTELTVLKATADPNASDGKTYLAGAEFTLTEVMNRGTEAGETADGSAREPQVLTGTTAEDGSVSFSGLKANTSYVLEETEAPAGYERLADTATLVVAPDGTATIADGNASGAFAVASDGVTIEVMDHKLGVSLVKTDLAGTALAGGTFKLAPADEGATFLDGTAEKEFTSDEFGAVFTDLQLEGSAEGTAYVLTETEAPAGFERIDPVTFLVYEDGTVALADTATDAQGEQVAIVNDAEDGIAVITVSDTPIELSLKKIDPDGKTLAGAEFKINGRFADGSTQAILTVDADGVIELPAPIAGETYTLSETAAPDGYERIMGTWSFQVTSDGSIDATDSSVVAIFGGQRSMGYAVADDGITILAVDVPTPPSDRLTSTGDSSLTLVCVCAAFGLMALAGGLRLRRKRR